MVAAAAPMLDVARDIASPNVEESRSTNRQLDAQASPPRRTVSAETPQAGHAACG
jgi:hypothetical protein